MTARRLILALVALYVITGYATQVFRAESEEWLDPDRILQISRNLCRRGEFAQIAGEPTLARGPAYPAALALPCWLTGLDGASFVPLVNGLCHLLTLTVLAGQRFARPDRVRQLALLAVGLDPLLLSYAGRTYLEPMLILAVALVIGALDRLTRRPDVGSMAALGVVWGLSLLVKPVLIYLIVALVPALFLLTRRAALLALGAFALALLMISPWTLRNHSLSGRFIPVATGAWQIALKGDTFSHSAFSADGIVSLENMAAEKLATIDQQLGISELPLQDREPYYMRHELREVWARPLVLGHKVAVQSLTFWILGGDRRNTVVFALLQIPLLCLLVAALVFGVPARSQLLGFAIVALYLWIAHSASLAIARYSMPLRPWIVMVAAVFVISRLWPGALATGRQRGRAFPHNPLSGATPGGSSTPDRFSEHTPEGYVGPDLRKSGGAQAHV